MVWHIRKTKKDETSGFQYYQGDDSKSPSGNPEPWGAFGTRATYTSQAKAKASNCDFDQLGWTISAVNENAS